MRYIQGSYGVYGSHVLRSFVAEESGKEAPDRLCVVCPNSVRGAKSRFLEALIVLVVPYRTPFCPVCSLVPLSPCDNFSNDMPYVSDPKQLDKFLPFL